MEKILSLLDSTDYALLIIQSTLSSLAAAKFVPASIYILAPLGIIAIRILIAFFIAVGALIEEQAETTDLKETINGVRERVKK